MQEQEIQIGKCYLNENSGKALVRKVHSIINGKVHYEFKWGSPFEKGLKYSTKSLRGFAKWAHKEVEDLQVYPYSTRSGFHKQKNFIVLNTKGEEYLRCQESKLKYYLRKNYVKHIEEDTYQFIVDYIENRFHELYGDNLPKDILAPKYQHCAVCGSENDLSSHHVIPKKDLAHYDIQYKMNFDNRIPICRTCHSEYEIIKEGVEFKEYNFESAIKWMNHFLTNMKPKYLNPDWHIVKMTLRKNFM